MVTSGGSDAVQHSTMSSNVSLLSAPSVVETNNFSKIFLFVTQLTREVHCIHNLTAFQYWGNVFLM